MLDYLQIEAQVQMDIFKEIYNLLKKNLNLEIIKKLLINFN
jgi:hypothetical protein